MDEQTNEIAGFRLVRLTGSDGAGGFGLGSLYEVVDGAGHHIAMKVASVQALAQVLVKAHNQHPNLIELFGWWIIDSHRRVIEEEPRGIGEFDTQQVSLAIATNGNEGASIWEYSKGVRNRGLSGIPLSNLLKYFESIAKGIDFLTVPKHIEGLGSVALHTFDVSPHDIRITGDGALFDDVGASVYSEVQRESSSGAFLGLPGYFGPERLEGKSSPQSVQYSLAVTYHELRTGVMPFANWQEKMIDLASILRERQLDLSRLPRGEATILEKAMSPNPEDRYQSCVELIHELRCLDE